ncbi:MAG: amidohydrolase [Agathobacter sp.]|nr:amidohydrolase [Agathobacter sp.]
MESNIILNEASTLQDKLIEIRHYLHTHPGVGFDIQETYQYVHDQLVQMGYAPHSYGKAGLIATIGHKTASDGTPQDKTILLRADMDALPIQEEADVDYKSTNGNMHSCGHDMHTTMLLGAAQILKNHENELKGQVVLCFQPAEETLEGAKDMIESGVLRDTTPDAAIMIHVASGMPFETGTIVVCNGGVSAPAADYFEINIQGKGCHGAMPQLGIDPITVAAHIVTGLQEIHARELSMFDDAVLTIGTIHSGNASNVIPDTAAIGGTIRTYDENVRNLIKNRMEEIITSIAAAFRAEATLKFTSGCPTLMNDESLSRDVTKYMKELLGPQKAFTKAELAALSGNAKASKATGSEDFAYFSHEVPSLMLAIAIGKPEDGYVYPLHHPKATFDETALSIGSAVHAYNAIRWLEEH